MSSPQDTHPDSVTSLVLTFDTITEHIPSYTANDNAHASMSITEIYRDPTMKSSDISYQMTKVTSISTTNSTSF